MLKITNKIKNYITDYFFLVVMFICLVLISSAMALDQGFVFNVKTFGAVGDSATMNTKTIQKAIDECAQNGGGTVYFPPGKYVTGSLILKSNVQLKLEANSYILGSQNLADYNPPHLIYAKEAENIAITGFGEINGRGEIFWRGKEGPYHRPENLICFDDCNNVRIKDITITNSPNWDIRLNRCDWVFIDGIRIFNFMDAPNTDGIDPISCANVFISNCYIETGDDAICLKSSEKDKPCENIIVTNCVLISDDSAIKCGTGSKGEIKHCLFNNIVIRDSDYGIGFYMKDGGVFEDIQFSNINIETTRLSANNSGKSSIYPIFMDIEPRDEKTPLGTIRNIVFRNININTQNGNCLIQGRSDKLIEDLYFENIRMKVLSRTDLSGRNKPRGTRTLNQKAVNDFANINSCFTFANIKGLTLKNIRVWDESETDLNEHHAIWGTNINNITLEGLSYHPTTALTKLPILYFYNCENLIARECAPGPATVPFLHLEGENTRHIRVIDNDLSLLKTPFEYDIILKKEFYESGNLLPGQ